MKSDLNEKWKVKSEKWKMKSDLNEKWKVKSEKYRLVFLAMDLQRKDYNVFFTFHFSLSKANLYFSLFTFH